MTSKKYTLLAGLGCLIASSGFAQVTPTHPYTAVHPLYGTYYVTDSNYYSSAWLPAHSAFMYGTSDYPAKPKDMWEIGIKGGSFMSVGDVDPRFLSPGFGAHIRKSLGHTVSLRLEYVYGIAKGQNKKPATGTANAQTSAWAPYGNGTVYYNSKTVAQELSLQALFNIHNIRFYKAQTNMTFYGLIGGGFVTWHPTVDALNGSSLYTFGANPSKSDLIDMRDGEYESENVKDVNQPWSKTFAGYYKPSITGGLGIAFRLSDRVNLALEDRVIFSGTDLYDGYTSSYTDQSKDLFNYLSLGLNFNIGNKAKRVEPLYWLNPLNYLYSEVRRVPEIVLPDADGDGVLDQFDQEQTPAGCPVDTHGVSRDTDGDGVPDCKDKELVTPTYCQPVDADGVGKCPCPEGCGAVVSECSTLLGALPSVSFSSNSVSLSDDAKASLGTVASKLKANPNCKVVVVGYCAGTKKQQQLSWDHVNAVINYLVESEGVSGDRFIFSSGQEGGDCDTVDIRAAAPGEDGPNTIPPPHPNLRKS